MPLSTFVAFHTPKEYLTATKVLRSSIEGYLYGTHPRKNWGFEITALTPVELCLQ